MLRMMFQYVSSTTDSFRIDFTYHNKIAYVRVLNIINIRGGSDEIFYIVLH